MKKIFGHNWLTLFYYCFQLSINEQPYFKSTEILLFIAKSNGIIGHKINNQNYFYDFFFKRIKINSNNNAVNVIDSVNSKSKS